MRWGYFLTFKTWMHRGAESYFLMAFLMVLLVFFGTPESYFLMEFLVVLE